jgi:hypothetical protein
MQLSHLRRGFVLLAIGCSQSTVPATKVAITAPAVAQVQGKKLSPPIFGAASPAWSDGEMELLELLLLNRFEGIQKNDAALVVMHAETLGCGIDKYVPDATVDSATLEAWEDFRRNNQKRVPLPNKLANKLPLRLLTESEYESIWYGSKRYCGWMRFYTLFPNAQGFQTVSRVGFSQDGNTAVVSLIDLKNKELVSAEILVFKKEQGVWQKPRGLYGVIS